MYEWLDFFLRELPLQPYLRALSPHKPLFPTQARTMPPKSPTKAALTALKTALVKLQGVGPKKGAKSKKGAAAPTAAEQAKLNKG